MKKLYTTALLGCLFCMNITLRAQNAVGIGTETPNTNAVLELVSPGFNQGLLVPTLTTAQRTATSFTGNLSVDENGLLVFDVTAGLFYYWLTDTWQTVRGLQLSAGEGISIDSNTGVITNSGDLDITNELQELTLAGNQLNISDNDDANPIDLSPYLDNQNAAEVAVTPNAELLAENVQLALEELQAEILLAGGLSSLPPGQLLVGDDGSLPVARTISGDITIDDTGIATIQTEAVGSTELADDGVTASKINADVAGLGLVKNGPTGALDVDAGTAANQIVQLNELGELPAVNGANLTGITADDADANPTNELQDLVFTSGIISLSDDPSPTSIDLSSYDADASDDLTTASGLENLADVGTLTTPQSGEVLKFNGSNWVNAPDGGLSTLSNGTVLIGDGTDVPIERTLSGDITLSNSGDAQIAGGAVGFNEIADLSITGGVSIGSKIALNTIEEGNLANSAITGGSGGVIADNTITADDLAAGVVGTAELVDDGVTAAKINGDVAGNGLTQNVGTGALEVNAGTGANQIVQLNGSGFLPTLNGSGLTSLTSSSIGANGIMSNPFFSGTEDLTTSLDNIGFELNTISNLTGVSLGVNNLGIFTGATIADDNSIKGALQELESALENNSPSLTDLSTDISFTSDPIRLISVDDPVSGPGGDLRLAAANAEPLSSFDGGNIVLTPGAATDPGVDGIVDVQGDLFVSGTIAGDGSALFGVLATGVTIDGASDFVALGENTGGIAGFSTLVGIDAGTNNTGTDNTFVGANAGTTNTSAAGSVFIGSDAGFANTTGGANTFLGSATGTSNTTGFNNVFIGNGAGSGFNPGGVPSMSSSGVLLFGFQADAASDGISNAIAIGNNAIVPASNSIALGDGNINEIFLAEGSNKSIRVENNSTGSGNSLSLLAGDGASGTFDGGNITLAPGINGGGGFDGFVDVQGDLAVSGVLSGDASGLSNVSVTGVNIDGTSFFTAVGESTGPASSSSTFLGFRTGEDITSGFGNTFVGSNAGRATQDGSSNLFVGDGAGLANVSGTDNTFLGTGSGIANSTGSSNIFIGRDAGSGVTATASAIGDNNILIGTGADVAADPTSDAIAIGFGAIAGADNSIAIGKGTQSANANTIILGDGSNSSFAVGIGTNSPGTELEVVGTVTADAYNYKAPVIKLLTIGVHQFSVETVAGDDSSTRMEVGNGSSASPRNNAIGTTENQHLSAPIILPDGATITKIEANQWRNINSSNDPTVELYRKTIGGAPELLATVTYAGGGGVAQLNETISIANPSVDNQLYQYWLRFTGDAGPAGALYSYTSGVRFTYTVISVD